MADDNKCPMGNHPWLATFLVVAFFLCFVGKSLGWFYWARKQTRAPAVQRRNSKRRLAWFRFNRPALLAMEVSF